MMKYAKSCQITQITSDSAMNSWLPNHSDSVPNHSFWSDSAPESYRNAKSLITQWLVIRQTKSLITLWLVIRQYPLRLATISPSTREFRKCNSLNSTRDRKMHISNTFRRREDNGNPGTFKYLGPVPFFPGIAEETLPWGKTTKIVNPLTYTPHPQQHPLPLETPEYAEQLKITPGCRITDCGMIIDPETRITPWSRITSQNDWIIGCSADAKSLITQWLVIRQNWMPNHQITEWCVIRSFWDAKSLITEWLVIRHEKRNRLPNHQITEWLVIRHSAR